MKTRPDSAGQPTNIVSGEVVFAPEQFLGFANLAEAFYYNAANNAEVIAYDQAQRESELPSGKRRYVAVSHGECAARVLKFAAFLEDCGVRSGDGVAILSLDRPEWTEAEMAVYTVGGFVVPAYVRDTSQRLGHILRDSGVSFAFAENQQQLDKLTQLVATDAGISLRHVITFESVERRDGTTPSTSVADILQRSPAARSPDSFAGAPTQRDEIACIYYTSGSTGKPKGVPATHGQILANLHQILKAELVAYDDERSSVEQPIVTFLLPERAHAYPSRSAQLVFTTPARARFPAVVSRERSDIDDTFRDSLRRDLREAGAGMIPIVPKIAMAIEQRVRQRLASGGVGERLAAFVAANDVAMQLNRVRGGTNLWSMVLHGILRPLRQRIARRIRREIVGREFQYFISGGAKLPLETAAFLSAIGLPIYEGYGSTESNCAIASNTPRQHRLGTVGRPYRDVEVRIDPQTNELLLRGPNIVTHYLHLEDETRATWDDEGWYHTRDAASLDADGYLQVEGRLDNMIVLLNGENVSPVAIENACATIPGVEAAIVIGDHRPALVALLALDEQAMHAWAKAAGRTLPAEWQRDADVLAWLRDEVDQRVNRLAGHPYECVRNVAIIDPPSVQQQTLTATEKLRRKEIERRYAGLIDQLYADGKHWLSPAQHPLSPARHVAAL